METQYQKILRDYEEKQAAAQAAQEAAYEAKAQIINMPFTVADLKIALEGVPDDAEINMEGCDCWGSARKVTYDERDNSIDLYR